MTWKFKTKKGVFDYAPEFEEQYSVNDDGTEIRLGGTISRSYTHLSFEYEGRGVKFRFSAMPITEYIKKNDLYNLGKVCTVYISSANKIYISHDLGLKIAEDIRDMLIDTYKYYRFSGDSHLEDVVFDQYAKAFLNI
ncbi:hypothetical protein [Beijerinckia indica]|uniref:Uncharacterized protein n=1 Tax=Beijerinckia indica subsp. indica (strain ATCC 9039 / DSM 1715 / NCIMB 8712) TaxID=395963 RepID=B2IL46_BEII9|nr:hypothetical protein [Beijerinckia indica]ACB97246.1 hypothetical protein Bind_3694 [Beijerinckia indica subsp. indica ATCC 9039]